MRPLFVDAVEPQRIKVTDKGLVVQSQETTTTFSLNNPKQHHDSLVVHGDAGYISLAAVNWCNQFGIPIHFISYDGSLLPNSGQAETQNRLWQLRASEDAQKRLDTAREIIVLKLVSSED